MALSNYILRWWSLHRRRVYRVAITFMAAFAAVKLGSEFFRLVFNHGGLGAVDLRFRYTEVHQWFAHHPIYIELWAANYPPMSYLILWLVLGWGTLDASRWVWAAASLLSLYWLCRITVRESGASTGLERIFAALLPLSINGTGVAVGNGQLVPLLAPMLCTGILLLARMQNTDWRSELGAVVLVLVSLVHPATAGPFFWIVLFVPRTIRPAALVVLGYLLLTVLAASFQPDSLPTLLRDWVLNSQNATIGKGSTDLHRLLHLLGLHGWALPASAVTITCLGLWTFVNRRADLWLLISVTAIVARTWTYHGLYDDLLFVFPMVALFRYACGEDQLKVKVTAATLLGLAILIMSMPARMHYFWNPPWPALYDCTHAAILLATLVFLLKRAHIERLASAGQAGTLACPNGRAEGSP